MGFGGGFDRDWLEPITDEGNTGEEHPEFGKAIGCHKGQHSYLNIYNAQQGFHYVWERKKPNDLRRAVQRGGQIVKADDPEMTGAALATGHDLVGTDDTLAEYNELQLVRYPESAMRKIREEEQARAQAMMRGADEDYVNSARYEERDAAHNPRGVKTRFATNLHRTEFDADGEITDQWSPDKGIIE